MISLSASSVRTSVGRVETREGKIEGKMRREETRKGENEKTRKKCARESLIRSSGGLSPSSCTLLGEYRLSVVRLGVLHSSKYLGIFEESRVPKKTVYFVRRDPSRESERGGPRTVIANVVVSFVDNQTRQHRACRKKIYKGKIYRVRFIRYALPRLCSCFGFISLHALNLASVISILIPVICIKCTTNCSFYHVIRIITLNVLTVRTSDFVHNHPS